MQAAILVAALVALLGLPTAVVAHQLVVRAERWGYELARHEVVGEGAYRRAVTIGWRDRRAPLATVLGAWSSIVVAVGVVPFALLSVLWAGLALDRVASLVATWLVDLATLPVALVVAVLLARGAIALLAADRSDLRRARAAWRAELVLAALLGTILAVAVALSQPGQERALAYAGLAGVLVLALHAVALRKACLSTDRVLAKEIELAPH